MEINMKYSFKDFLKATTVVESLMKTRGNAYSLSRHLSHMINADVSKTIMSSDNIAAESIDVVFGDKSKGGIITFSLEVNANQQSANKLADFVKKKLKTISNKLTFKKKIDGIANSHELVGWTIGKYLDGRYYSRETKKQYSEDSLSLEIIGIGVEEPVKIAEELCEAFDQESVLVKDYSTGSVMLVKADI